MDMADASVKLKETIPNEMLAYLQVKEFLPTSLWQLWSPSKNLWNI